MSVVLIVEDEILEQEFLRSVVQEELSPEDTLISCESGLQAVKLSKQHQPDFIFMDVILPEMDGLAAIEDVRTFLPDTCVTVLSAYSDFNYAQRAIGLGVFDYLLKPIKPAAFIETFRKMRHAAARSATKAEPLAATPSLVKKEHQCFVQEALKYIHDHFRERLTLEKVAAQVFVNPKYFSHVFKRETGVAFTEYVINLRIDYACQLLSKTNYPAYRISFESGFSDPSYFNRVFCSRMSMTPQAYRRTASA